MTETDDDLKLAVRLRSVMDFESRESLYEALESCADSSCYTPTSAPLIVDPKTGVKGCGSPTLPDWQLDTLDLDSSCAQNLEEEMVRLQVLRSYRILNSEREGKYERITALAVKLFDVPAAAVTLVDLGRQWFLSTRGLGEVRETPRRFGMCAHAILSTHDLFVVTDTTKDVRFKNHPMVTGEPYLRFYGGAPLICPEGYKLGALCILDVKPRPAGLSLDEKQNLRELAALIVESMVASKQEWEEPNEDEGKIIACTAHDLLTPLKSIHRNLAQLIDDKHLPLVEDQRELAHAALSCSEVLDRVCHQTIDSYRGDIVRARSKRKRSEERQRNANKTHEDGTNSAGTNASDEDDDENEVGCNQEGAVVVSRLMENLRQVISPYPKKVPLTMEISEGVPPVIISNDLKIFRSALNMLSNACKMTESGSIAFRVYAKATKHQTEKIDPEKECFATAQHTGEMLVFECTDTGPGVDVSNYSSLFVPFRGTRPLNDRSSASSRFDGNYSTPSDSGLGLYSVASNIGSLDGEYGFRPRHESRHAVSGIDSTHAGADNPDFKHSVEKVTGSVFWFSVPIVLPTVASSKLHRNSLSYPPTNALSDDGQPTDKVECSFDESSLGDVASSLFLSECDKISVTSPVTLSPTEKERVHKRARCDLDVQLEAEAPKTEHRLDAENAQEPNDSVIEECHDAPSTVSSPSLAVADTSEQKLPRRQSTNAPKTEHRSDAENAQESKGFVTEKCHDAPSTVSSPYLAVADTSEQKLPRRQSAYTQRIPQPSVIDQGQLPHRSQRTKRALIIDDSLTIRKGIDRALSRLGFEVRHAVNGMDGLKELKSSLFDLVLCDFLMPVMDGLDCVQQYREWESGHRKWFRQCIVGISAHANSNDADRGLDVGMDSYFAKPLLPKTLKVICTSPEVETASKQLDEKFERTLKAQEQESRSMAQFMEDTKEADDESVSSTSSAKSFSTRVCLIADDSKSVSEAVAQCVERKGWHASVVEHGEEALKLLKMRNWDAVFLVDQMPRLSGMSCVFQFREWEAENRVARQNNVFLISGNYRPKAHNMFPAGFDGAIGKPIKVEDVHRILDTVTMTRNDQQHILLR